MYHKIKEQERCPEKYTLAKVSPNVTEDPVFDLLSKPRLTQNTVGFYLKKVRDRKENTPNVDDECCTGNGDDQSQISPYAFVKKLEKNKGFWVGKPQSVGWFVNEMQQKHYVTIPKKDQKGTGIFSRPYFYELDYLKKLKAEGYLKRYEEGTDSDEEVEPEKKTKYVICDPCKEKPKKKKKPEETPPKDLIEEFRYSGILPTFKKIPFGCQCDYYWEHGKTPAVWDTFYNNRVDMLRQHEMNKFLRPYKSYFLRQFSEKNPSVKFKPYEFGMKRTFPEYSITNL